MDLQRRVSARRAPEAFEKGTIIMGDWLLNLSIPWMAFVVFGATYVVAACVYLLVVRLAGDRAHAFKAFSPGMLPQLGIIFGLLVGFVAVQVWNDFDKAKLAVATEASALRAVVLLAENLTCGAPFSGEILVKPELLQQVVPSETTTSQSNAH
jgi:hypothetical protein